MARYFRFALPALALLAACAPSGTPGGAGAASETTAAAAADAPRECFFVRQANGYSSAGDDAIYVDVGASDVYLFELYGGCPNLDFSLGIALDPRGPSSICRGTDVNLIVPSPIGPQRCPVRMIRKLTDAEAEAL